MFSCLAGSDGTQGLETTGGRAAGPEDHPSASRRRHTERRSDRVVGGPDREPI